MKRVLLVLIACVTLVSAEYKVGVTTKSFRPKGDAYNWRGARTPHLLTSIWYPADNSAPVVPQWIGDPSAPFASAGTAAPDAQWAPRPARFPLVLLSHGTGGTSLMMAWLGTALAKQGYIAAAVNHPGNNALEPYTPQGFGLWWERATDVSRVLDSMLAEPLFRDRIDTRRIGAAGFSLGGYTVVTLAGGIGTYAAYEAFCQSPHADGICNDIAEFPGLRSHLAKLAKDPEYQAALSDADRSRRDPRIRAMFAIAPATGPAFSPQSLRKISIPVAIVSGEGDRVVPVDSSARFFAKHIPRATLTLYKGGVGHYTFLATCAQAGKTAQPILCVDADGVDRDSVHAQAARDAINFFGKHLR